MRAVKAALELLVLPGQGDDLVGLIDACVEMEAVIAEGADEHQCQQAADPQQS